MPDRMTGVALQRLVQTSHEHPHIRKDDLAAGDWVFLRTLRSVYALRVIGGGMYEARGGWFDAKGSSPQRIGVSGATWGGSAIMPQILAACGMRVEFSNRLRTSPVVSIVVLPGTLLN